MNINAIKSLLEEHFPSAEIELAVEGSHLSVAITSEVFSGLMPVKRQQLVYAALNEKIVSGEVHAVNIKTLTPSQ